MSVLLKEKSSWDELDVNGLLRLVYRNYPTYSIHAILKELKWSSK